MLFLEQRIETQGFLETKGGFLMLTITRAVLANPQTEAQFPSACRTRTSTTAKAGTHLSALPTPGTERSCAAEPAPRVDERDVQTRELPHDRTVAPDARKELPVAAPT